MTTPLGVHNPPSAGLAFKSHTMLGQKDAIPIAAGLSTEKHMPNSFVQPSVEI
ncbi:MAG: hypothetical protein BWY09_02826 [Candidatus Hydrogenedentes bacterium ADurb.Bin179]|nr:MAG: hypothetical protein BWY09_02826 [Candidatus Hydrogenedentes bacterium ADurb.Bin179]